MDFRAHVGDAENLVLRFTDAVLLGMVDVQRFIF